jgi:hypothetical protein
MSDGCRRYGGQLGCLTFSVGGHGAHQPHAGFVDISRFPLFSWRRFETMMSSAFSHRVWWPMKSTAKPLVEESASFVRGDCAGAKCRKRKL